MGRFIAIGLTCCFLGAVSAPKGVAADEAKTLYEKGVALFEKGEYAAAQEAFKEAYNLSGRAALLFNLGVCAEKLGDLQRAIAYYQIYLDEQPEAADAEKVRGRMERLRQQLDKPEPAVEIVPLEDTGSSDGAEPEPAPSKAEKKPEAPPEPAPAPEPGPSDTKVSSLVDGTAGPVVNGEISSEDRERSLYAPGALLGGGGLLLAGGIVAGIAARNEHDALEKSCAPECSQSAVTKGKRIAVTADILLGLGAASAVAGGVWLLLDRWRKERTGEITLSAGPLRDGAALVVRGSFP